MFYVLRRDCYIRKIDKFGYIKSSGLFNDLVFDESGAKFLDALTRTPQNLKELSLKISKSFVDVTDKDIIDDVEEFFDNLVDDGFVIKGKTKKDAIEKNVGFQYKDIKQMNFEEDYTPKNIRSKNTSQEYLDAYFIKRPYLSNFQIELTSKCNERCIHCYIPHEFKNSDIKEELFYSVLNQLKKMGTLGVTLSGGEPMLHPKFKEFLKAAKDMDFYVHILSNLTLLDDEIIEIMKDGNHCGVQVSLYSLIPEHHDSITSVKGSFNKTSKNILKLIKNNIPVQINCPIMKANKNDARDVILWGHKHKIRTNIDYAIMAEYNHCVSNLAHRLDPEECRKVIKDIMDCDEDYKELIKKDFQSTKKPTSINKNEPFCGVGINTACMVANGNVYPCPGWQSYVCGNLYKQSLIDIWLNSKEMKYLRSLKKKDMPKCLNCKQREFCSPCLSRFANESKTGNPLEIANHFCKVAKVNQEVVFQFLSNSKNRVTSDYHVHCGQFYDEYYSPKTIMKCLHENGIKRCYISSTTSCKSFNSELDKIDVLSRINKEINECIKYGKQYEIEVLPLYWVIPKVHYDGIDIKKVMDNSLYKGFKIHPKFNDWSINNKKSDALFDEVAQYASSHNFPIIIHTGEDKNVLPNRFEKFFSIYPNVKFILAHCKEPDKIIRLFSKYQNVYGDTAFCPKDSYLAICKAGYSSRMLPGTDFPLTYWFDNDDKNLSLNYKKTINALSNLLSKETKNK